MSDFDEKTTQFDVDELLGDDLGTQPESVTDTAAIDISQVRRDYRRSGLRRSDLSSDPILQVTAWLDEAGSSDLREPTAVNLATASASGMPSARMVLLKGCDARGFTFFTSYSSRKGQELQANPQAALCFFWPELERQIRIEGRVERVSREESADYFTSRPYGSQISAACSPQSQVVAHREELESRRREVENRYAGGKVECPEDWGGYRLWPESVEVWQGRRNRLHDRFRYRRNPDGDPITGDEWLLERLAP